MTQRRTPCNACPWRKDIPPGDWTVDRFQNLYTTCQDDGMAVMACHKSNEGEDFACAGFVLQLGFDSIGIRLQARAGRVRVEDYDANGLELYEDFDAMLEANDVPLPPRNCFKP